MEYNYNVGDIVILTKDSDILNDVGIVMKKYKGVKAR